MKLQFFISLTLMGFYGYMGLHKIHGQMTNYNTCNRTLADVQHMEPEICQVPGTYKSNSQCYCANEATKEYKYRYDYFLCTVLLVKIELNCSGIHCYCVDKDGKYDEVNPYTNGIGCAIQVCTNPDLTTPTPTTAKTPTTTMNTTTTTPTTTTMNTTTTTTESTTAFSVRYSPSYFWHKLVSLFY